MGESLVGAARNLFQIPGRLPDEEFFEELLNTPSLRVERIVSTGQVSPQDFWYDQEEDEWVALLQGEAELEFDDGRTLKLQKGDWAFLPARARHRVSFTSAEPPCIWLAVFAPPAERCSSDALNP
ncbi:MAG: cupin domain-containing protein [Aminivibrio sp.]|jgi:cupin 2 domain-containing protein